MSTAAEQTRLGPLLLPEGLELTPARRRVLEVAVQLFGERGYHGVSMRELADALGIKAPSLYAHVESKQQLLYELASIGQSAHRDRMLAALLETSSDPTDQLQAIVREHVRMHLELPLLARITNLEARHLEPDNLDRVLAIGRDAERIFVELIQRGQRMGAFTAQDYRWVTRAIADIGIRVSEWRAPISEDPQEIIDEYVRLSMRLVGAEQ